MLEYGVRKGIIGLSSESGSDRRDMKRIKVKKYRKPIDAYRLTITTLKTVAVLLVGTVVVAGCFLIARSFAPSVDKSYEDVLSEEYNLSSLNMESALNDSRGLKVMFKDISTDSDDSHDRKTIQVSQEFMEDGEVKIRTNDVVIGDKNDDGEYEIIKRGQKSVRAEGNR